jgi:hypothetical protein
MEQSVMARCLNFHACSGDHSHWHTGVLIARLSAASNHRAPDFHRRPDRSADAHTSHGPSPELLKAFDERAAVRRASLHGMLDRGEITSGSDLYEAAFVFQHGETASDYLLAHVLALDALGKGFDRAKWLSAATLDRYLQLIGQAQVFGTQYPLDPKLPHPITNGGGFSGRTQSPFNETFLPAYLRRDFCVPDLEQQKKNLQTLNAGSYPRATMTLQGCER